MVVKDGQPKFHSGCFLSKNEKAGFEVSVTNCASLCNKDTCCKGFAIGQESVIKKNNKGCVLVTNTDNCTTRFPEFGGYVGELVDADNIPKYYGFSGCFKNTVDGEYIHQFHSYETVSRHKIILIFSIKLSTNDILLQMIRHCW